MEEAVEVMCDNRTSTIKNETAEEHHLNVITHHALVNKGFWQSEESIQNANQPTTSKECKANGSVSGSHDDAATNSQVPSEEIEEDTKF